MHKGIAAHSYDILADNASELTGMNFAFICIDGGMRKKAIVEKLEQAGISFIDTGLGVELGADGPLGMVRLTTSTREQRDHFRSKVSLVDGNGEKPIPAQHPNCRSERAERSASGHQVEEANEFLSGHRS